MFSFPLLRGLLFDTFLENQLALIDEAGQVIATALCIPLSWDGTPGGLPAG